MEDIQASNPHSTGCDLVELRIAEAISYNLLPLVLPPARGFFVLSQ